MSHSGALRDGGRGDAHLARASRADPVMVAPANPRDPGPAALLRESHALMEALFPPEDNHHLDLDALAAPGIRFFTATEGPATLGTAALAIRPGYGEVKAMFTAHAARGRGVGAALLARIEAEARALGLAVLRLETGDRLAEARRLYESRGFVPCVPFGGYRAGGTSLFYEKRLG